jgi:putative salt-induced outer membrane protein
MKRTNRTYSWLGRGACAILVALSVATTGAQTSSPAATNAPVAPPKKPAWEGSAALGLTVTRGNSDTLLFNLNVVGLKKWAKNELRLGADGTYGEQTTESGGKSDTTINNEQAKGVAQYNRIFGQQDRWFWYGRGEAMHDGVANVEGRFTLSPGIGYYFIKTEKMSLSAEAGPGLIEEKIGDASWHGYFTFRAAERFEYKINDRAKLWQMAEWLPQLDDFNNYILNATLGVSTAITPKWDLRVVLQDTYDNQPAPGRKQNDLKLVAGVGFKFL